MMASLQMLFGGGWMAGFMAVCLFLAGAAAVAWLVAVAGERGFWCGAVERLRGIRGAGRVWFALVAGWCVYVGGTKTNGTYRLERPDARERFTAEEISAGFVCVEEEINLPQISQMTQIDKPRSVNF